MYEYKNANEWNGITSEKCCNIEEHRRHHGYFREALMQIAWPMQSAWRADLE